MSICVFCVLNKYTFQGTKTFHRILYGSLVEPTNKPTNYYNLGMVSQDLHSINIGVFELRYNLGTLLKNKLGYTLILPCWIIE